MAAPRVEQAARRHPNEGERADTSTSPKREVQKASSDDNRNRQYPPKDDGQRLARPISPLHRIRCVGHGVASDLQHADPDSWIGGQGTSAYEQNMQQSPGLGFRTEPQPLQS